MSHAIHSDAGSADASLAGYQPPLSSEPISWRAAAFVIAVLSTAGWLGLALALRQLIG